MNKKYEFVEGDEIVIAPGRTVKRIRALVAISYFCSAGSLGGYIESEKSLDQSGDAWVSGNAQVYGDAQVSGNAWVSGNARVYGKLKLTVGFFFGFLKKDEKLEEIETEEGNKLLWKK